MTKAFDTAQFVPSGQPNPGQSVQVTSGPGMPVLTTGWANYAISPPGVFVGATIPAAGGEGQSLVAGPGPDFDWIAADTGSTLPQPTEGGQSYISSPDDPFPMTLFDGPPQDGTAYARLDDGWTEVLTPSGGGFTGPVDLVAGSTMPTPAPGSNTTEIANTAFVANAITNAIIDAGTF